MYCFIYELNSHCELTLAYLSVSGKECMQYSKIQVKKYATNYISSLTKLQNYFICTKFFL